MFHEIVEYQICTKIGGVNIVAIYGRQSIESDAKFDEKWLDLGEFAIESIELYSTSIEDLAIEHCFLEL